MKASEFKNLIKEAVREAIREELAEVTTTAPAQSQQIAPAATPVQFTGGNPLMEALNMTSKSMTSEDYRNMGTATSNMAQMFNRSAFMPKQELKPISDDPRAVAQAVAAAPKTGIDLSQLSFVNKAAAIVNQSNKKKEPYGV
jgi:CHASE3 domain sensor protein